MAKWGEPSAFLEQALAAESDECILWPFAQMTSGYGFFKVRGGGPFFLTNRYVCHQIYGPPPFKGARALHSCDVRHCVNKRHLRWGTARDNIMDSIARGRWRPKT